MSVLRFVIACLLFAAPLTAGSAADDKPNIVLIVADDLGYGDLGCYGGKDRATPNLDRLASQGVRFTDFYVAQAVCSASRAALLTGRYPNRVGILGALGPRSKNGIRPDERLLPEVLTPRGYATAIFGKWHLGDAPHFLPTRHGFEEYLGLPYSNDMWPHHPAAKPGTYPPLPLIENGSVTDGEVTDEDQRQLTTRYAERAARFIGKNKDRPFLLYLAHSMPHVPLFVSDRFAGRSGRGVYGDVLMEIDWSVGQVLDALKRHGLDERTLVIFTSDNGPWLTYGDHAGSAGPLRAGKGTTFEGGPRVPCVMRWPGKIPPGTVCREMALAMDLLPTVAKLAGAKPPADELDGRDIWPLIAGDPGAKTPHEAFFYYWGRELQAVRSGRWKLHLPHTYPFVERPGSGGRPGKTVTREIGLALFDLEADIGETADVAGQHPDVVERLRQLAAQARDAVQNPPPIGTRPAPASRTPPAVMPEESENSQKP